MRRCRGMCNAIKRAVRNAAVLAGVTLVLPASCGLGGSPETGGIQSSLPDRAPPLGRGFTDVEHGPMTREGLPVQ